MMRRVFTLLVATTLIGLFSVSEADAARYHRRSARISSPTVKRFTYPRYRQIDGKSLWNLGKQNGRWPKL
jgi:hypothetical protein